MCKATCFPFGAVSPLGAFPRVTPPLAPSFPLQLPWWRRHRRRGEGADHRWSQRAKSGHLRYNSFICVDACQWWTFFLLNVAADGDAARHSRASYRRRTPGGRSHLFFHSPPSKQGLISSSSRRHQLFQLHFFFPPEIRNQLDWCDQPLGQPRLQVGFPRKAPDFFFVMAVVKSLHLASSSLSEDAIMDIIASLMVLPNRMCVPLIDQVKVDQMRFPLPRVCKTRSPFQTLELPSRVFTKDY